MINFLDTITDLKELGKYVKSLEGKKELPPLPEIYVGLGAYFLAFNVDPDFNNSVDGMIVVSVDNFSDATLRSFFRQYSEEYKKLRDEVWKKRLKGQPGNL